MEQEWSRNKSREGTSRARTLGTETSCTGGEKAAAAAPVSAFGSDPPALFCSGGFFPLSLFLSFSLSPPNKPWMSGGGDDSWGAGIGWGSKKKKSNFGATSSGSSSPWGANVLGKTTPTALLQLHHSRRSCHPHKLQKGCSHFIPLRPNRFPCPPL